MKYNIYIFIFILSLYTTNSMAQVVPIMECYNTQITSQTGQQNVPASYSCNFNDINDPNSKNFDFEPNSNSQILKVRINLHIMQKSDGSGNFQNTPQDIAYLYDLINQMNYMYSHIEAPLNGGSTNDAYIFDSKIQFEVVNILFHKDDIGWNNNGDFYSYYCYNTYSTNSKHELDLYFINNPNPAKVNIIAGIGQALMGESSCFEINSAIYQDYINNPSGSAGAGQYGGSSWPSQQLSHETGHCLGLYHTFQDGLSDTYSPDISGTSTFCSPCCLTNCSNNVMSYSNTRKYISPLQIGKMRRLLTTGWRSKMVDNCSLENSDISLNSIIVWDLPRILDGNLILNYGCNLTTSCKVYMPRNKNITINNGSALNINSTFENNCGNGWNGITVKTGGLLVLSTTNISDYNITIESGGTVIIKGSLVISGTHNITVQSGAYLCIESGTSIQLVDCNSLIKINEGALNGVNPSLSVQSNCVSLPSSIITSGNGSIVDFNQDVYIQNMNISTSKYIGGRIIYVGNHVTTTKSYGDVLVNGGANAIFDCKEITFDTGFECASGSSYEVKNH